MIPRRKEKKKKTVRPGRLTAASSHLNLSLLFSGQFFFSGDGAGGGWERRKKGKYFDVRRRPLSSRRPSVCCCDFCGQTRRQIDESTERELKSTRVATNDRAPRPRPMAVVGAGAAAGLLGRPSRATISRIKIKAHLRNSILTVTGSIRAGLRDDGCRRLHGNSPETALHLCGSSASLTMRITFPLS